MGKTARATALLAALCTTSACDLGRPTRPEHDRRSTEVADDRAGDTIDDEKVGFPVSRGRSVQWKRNAQLEADLMRALELSRDEVCLELGTQSCVRSVHTVALGGNDPFGAGLLKPSATSLSTTSLAVDRVTLSACSARARADREGRAKVFTSLKLAGPAPAADAPETAATFTTLFRRLLARDPKPAELATLRTLLSEDGAAMTAEEFATLSCFVVASSLESIFF